MTYSIRLFSKSSRNPFAKKEEILFAFLTKDVKNPLFDLDFIDWHSAANFLAKIHVSDFESLDDRRDKVDYNLSNDDMHVANGKITDWKELSADTQEVIELVLEQEGFDSQKFKLSQEDLWE